MSERVVILGPYDDEKMKAAEITPMDAEAFLNGGGWRVRLSLLDGPLANATVIGPDPIDRPISEGDWRAAMSICTSSLPFELDLPLGLTPFGSTDPEVAALARRGWLHSEAAHHVHNERWQA